MGENSLDISIRTTVELEELRRLEDALQRQIVTAKAMGREFKTLESNLASVRSQIAGMGQSIQQTSGHMEVGGRHAFMLTNNFVRMGESGVASFHSLAHEAILFNRTMGAAGGAGALAFSGVAAAALFAGHELSRINEISKETDENWKAAGAGAQGYVKNLLIGIGAIKAPEISANVSLQVIGEELVKRQVTALKKDIEDIFSKPTPEKVGMQAGEQARGEQVKASQEAVEIDKKLDAIRNLDNATIKTEEDYKKLFRAFGIVAPEKPSQLKGTEAEFAEYEKKVLALTSQKSNLQNRRNEVRAEFLAAGGVAGEQERSTAEKLEQRDREEKHAAAMAEQQKAVDIATIEQEKVIPHQAAVLPESAALEKQQAAERRARLAGQERETGKLQEAVAFAELPKKGITEETRNKTVAAAGQELEFKRQEFAKQNEAIERTNSAKIAEAKKKEADAAELNAVNAQKTVAEAVKISSGNVGARIEAERQIYAAELAELNLKIKQATQAVRPTAELEADKVILLAKYNDKIRSITTLAGVSEAETEKVKATTAAIGASTVPEKLDAERGIYKAESSAITAKAMAANTPEEIQKLAAEQEKLDKQHDISLKKISLEGKLDDEKGNQIGFEADKSKAERTHNIEGVVSAELSITDSKIKQLEIQIQLAKLTGNQTNALEMQKKLIFEQGAAAVQTERAKLYGAAYGLAEHFLSPSQRKRQLQEQIEATKNDPLKQAALIEQMAGMDKGKAKRDYKEFLKEHSELKGMKLKDLAQAQQGKRDDALAGKIANALNNLNVIVANADKIGGAG